VCGSIAKGNLLVGRRLPDQARTALAAASLPHSPADVGSFRDVDLNGIAAAIDQTLRSGQHLSLKEHFRYVAFCLWQTTPALASDLDVLRPLLLDIAGRSQRTIERVALAYLRDFRPDRPNIQLVARFIALARSKLSQRSAALHDGFGAFEESGADRLAEVAIAQQRSVPEMLTAMGFRETEARGGFAAESTRRALLLLASRSEMDSTERLGFVRTLALTPEGRLIFAGQGPALVEALLRPLINASGKVERQPLLDTILKALGDPRLDRANWIAVAPDLKQLVVRWLSRVSLQQFLEVIARTNSAEMFQERRGFWEGVFEFYEGRAVDVEAWAAFGEDGARLARRAFEGMEFATLYQERKQVAPRQAVLLLRIGSVFVVEWSDNGKCHIWSDASAPDAPRLYQRRYGSNEIQVFSGQGNFESEGKVAWVHAGNWRAKVAGRLRELTGLSVPSRIYLS
jgi:hypothetical protein